MVEVFRHYAPQNGMDIRAFIKSLKDGNLLDEHFTKVDADLAFARRTAKGSRRISHEEYLQILRGIARRRSVSDEDIFRLAKNGLPDADEPAVEERLPTSGPERFFYDTSTYTGVHKYGTSPERRGRTSPPRAAARSPSPRGPERFFYDKTTYTGTHRHGGPTAGGNGLPKEGYKDLCEVGLREDAAMPRPKRRPRKEAKSDPELVKTEPAPSPKPAEAARPVPMPLPILLGSFNHLGEARSFLGRSASSEVKDDLAEEPKHERGTASGASLPESMSRVEAARPQNQSPREHCQRSAQTRKPPTTLGIGTRFIPVAPPMPSISLDLSVDSSNLSSLLELSD
ncbi:hypothetical protein AK812_SmicGene429 [Symbiodinium microadriaticum]|uniref:Uncharacterized protein n=1 Tax=Symbiodinium microadriaticum TaxID=2951 RepID=A0A1Q9F6V1_SYMMI|nr:hypothetical protein AK812_SmicGene429 [Symbiodinium microadriaticum]